MTTPSPKPDNISKENKIELVALKGAITGQGPHPLDIYVLRGADSPAYSCIKGAIWAAL